MKIIYFDFFFREINFTNFHPPKNSHRVSGIIILCIIFPVTNGAEGGVDELSQEEAFEEKLRDAMDLASQKSAQGRTMALESMCTAFNKKFIPEFVEDRRMTITGNLKKKHLKV